MLREEEDEAVREGRVKKEEENPSVGSHIKVMFPIAGFEGLGEKERFSLVGTETKQGDTNTHTQTLSTHTCTPVFFFAASLASFSAVHHLSPSLSVLPTDSTSTAPQLLGMIIYLFCISYTLHASSDWR